MKWLHFEIHVSQRLKKREKSISFITRILGELWTIKSSLFPHHILVFLILSCALTPGDELISKRKLKWKRKNINLSVIFLSHWKQVIGRKKPPYCTYLHGRNSNVNKTQMKLMRRHFDKNIRKHVIHLIPLFANQAAGEQGLRVQPAQQVECQLQGKEAQEITLEQCFQSIGQMTELCSAT